MDSTLESNCVCLFHSPVFLSFSPIFLYWSLKTHTFPSIVSQWENRKMENRHAIDNDAYFFMYMLCVYFQWFFFLHCHRQVRLSANDAWCSLWWTVSSLFSFVANWNVWKVLVLVLTPPSFPLAVLLAWALIHDAWCLMPIIFIRSSSNGKINITFVKISGNQVVAVVFIRFWKQGPVYDSWHTKWVSKRQKAT